jgi:hypothetical protein
MREIDDLPATVWWGVQVRQSRLHTCTVHCTRAGILCSSGLTDLPIIDVLLYLITANVYFVEGSSALDPYMFTIRMITPKQLGE